jgi:hypothetical protein
MSTRRVVNYDTGKTLKAIITRLTDGYVWNTSGTPAFETYNASNIANYGVALTEQGASGRYVLTMPSLAAGVYDLDVRVLTGASLAQSDTHVAGGVVEWGGSKFGAKLGQWKHTLDSGSSGVDTVTVSEV